MSLESSSLDLLVRPKVVTVEVAYIASLVRHANESGRMGQCARLIGIMMPCSATGSGPVSIWDFSDVPTSASDL